MQWVSRTGVYKSPFGNEPQGILTYTKNHIMNVIIVASEEINDTDLPIGRYIAYAGTYKISDDHIIHEVKVATLDRLINSQEKRYYSLTPNDQLILSSDWWHTDDETEWRANAIVWEKNYI